MSLHHVYRAFDSYGLLLYVGCSKAVTKRIATHRSQAPWYRYAETFGISGPWERREAFDRERTAIDTEAPYFNSSFADMKRTNANIVAARRNLWERGQYEPDLDLDRFDAEGQEYADAVERARGAWRHLHDEERARLKSGRFPYMTDRERLDRYLAAREDAESARLEDAAA